MKVIEAACEKLRHSRNAPRQAFPLVGGIVMTTLHGNPREERPTVALDVITGIPEVLEQVHSTYD